MPYKLTDDVRLQNADGLTIAPSITIAGDTVVDILKREKSNGRLLAQIRTRGAAKSASKEGWVRDDKLVPVYGQTEMRGGIVLLATKEVIDKCRRFSKRLDNFFKHNKSTTTTHFMIGILLCEDLDGKKKFYASIAGHRDVLPAMWEFEARTIDCIPALNLPAGARFRTVSGRVIKLIKPGGRHAKQTGKLKDICRKQNIKHDHLNWDKLGGSIRDELEGRKEISRIEHAQPGACAAEKMLQEAFKKFDTPRSMVEMWYDEEHGDLHGVMMESCLKCRINISRMLKR